MRSYKIRLLSLGVLFVFIGLSYQNCGNINLLPNSLSPEPKSVEVLDPPDLPSLPSPDLPSLPPPGPSNRFPNPKDYCEEYLNTLDDEEYDDFLAYRAEERGMHRTLKNKKNMPLKYATDVTKQLPTLNPTTGQKLSVMTPAAQVGGENILGVGELTVGRNMQTGNLVDSRIGGLARGRGLAIPGYLEDNEYVALEFTMPPVSTCTGQCKVQTDANQGSSVVLYCDGGVGSCTGSGLSNISLTGWYSPADPLAVTVSPCQGDFRPRLPKPRVGDMTFAKDSYKNYGCSPGGYIGGEETGDYNFKVRSSTNNPRECLAPVGKKMYINISIRNLFKPGQAYPVPEDNSIPGGTAWAFPCPEPGSPVRASYSWTNYVYGPYVNADVMCRYYQYGKRFGFSSF